MNREIKFRAWLKKQKIMRNNVSLHDGKIWTGYAWIPLDDNIELMQYTGLKDKNGVKIFEGDIVRVEDKICYIAWSEYYSAFVLRFADCNDDMLGDSKPKYLEVIGNIYENSELLGGKNDK